MNLFYRREFLAYDSLSGNNVLYDCLSDAIFANTFVHSRLFLSWKMQSALFTLDRLSIYSGASLWTATFAFATDVAVVADVVGVVVVVAELC